ncbi:MAG: hypothetical protein OD814_000172 [Candidatus Alkanophagales archaeon MCA70_species_1]|nr:hypothetical protein [Candidatus Alkanophaga volatiphilum]
MECDVLVVGAGPAVAALYCSKNGLDAVLVERGCMPEGGWTRRRIQISAFLGQ